MPGLVLSEIWIYPIKSLGGIRCQQALIKPRGLEFDRRWMLVDADGKFMTQRTFPQMALFNVSLENEKISIHHKKNNSFHKFDMGKFENHQRAVTIWDDSINAYEVSTETSAWFSEQLNIKCQLVFFPEENPRPVDRNYAHGNEHVSLADGYPFLIIGQASLDDLNTRLTDPVTINRFRPNFVFTGGEPFAEDSWKEFSVGTKKFIGVKNCSRCVLTTVNPYTGEKGHEPLRTLSTYRKRGSDIYFGQNVLAMDSGTIEVGDVITFA